MFYNSKEKLEKLIMKMLNINYSDLLIKDQGLTVTLFYIIYLNGEQLLVWLKADYYLYLLKCSTVM